MGWQSKSSLGLFRHHAIICPAIGRTVAEILLFIGFQTVATRPEIFEPNLVLYIGRHSTPYFTRRTTSAEIQHGGSRHLEFFGLKYRIFRMTYQFRILCAIWPFLAPRNPAGVRLGTFAGIFWSRSFVLCVSIINKYVSPPNTRTEMHAGRVACCTLVSRTRPIKVRKKMGGTDGRTDARPMHYAYRYLFIYLFIYYKNRT